MRRSLAIRCPSCTRDLDRLSCFFVFFLFRVCFFFLFFFFLQAEDGIRDRTVTGVQTCALPISLVQVCDQHNRHAEIRGLLAPLAALAAKYSVAIVLVTHLNKSANGPAIYRAIGSIGIAARSEERRVGKEWRTRWPLSELDSRRA